MSFTCEQSDIIRGGIVWCSWREEGDGDGGCGVVLREALIACWSFPSRKERGQSRGENVRKVKHEKKKKKKKKRRDTFFVISFIVVITLILLDSLCLSRLSLSLSLLIMCFYLRFLRCAELSLRAQSFNLRLEVRLLLFVRQLRQLELLTGVSRLRSRLLRKTRVFANRVVDFLV